LSLLDLFRKDEVVGTRVLVCALDTRYSALAVEDAKTYKKYYAATTAIDNATANDLLRYITGGYDIVHILCDVNESGIAGSSLSGTGLIESCCAADVKLLWIASDNDPNAYISGFNLRRKRLNIVMTLTRNGQSFEKFLEQLVFRMAYGEAMPVAWNDLCPQIPHSSHGDVPASIFAAGRGGVKLLR